MAKLTDEEIRILQRARMIQDRLEAEKLESGEVLPAKKTQPRIQNQKINKAKQAQANRTVPSQKSADLENKQSKSPEEIKPVQKPEEEMAHPKNTAGVRQAVRQPVATVEEKRNRKLAEGPVRKPVATIDTRRGENSEKKLEKPVQAKKEAQKQSALKEAQKHSAPKEVQKRSVPKEKTRTSASNVRRKPLKKKKTAKWKIVLIAFIITFLIAAIAAVGAFILIYSNVSKTNYEPISQTERFSDVLPVQRGVKNILLLGTDERVSGETSRSDAIIVLSINENQKKIVMTSILRDSYVEIPGYGKNRINHAYQMGGAALMIQTIENNFKIPIDSYAKVDFFSFMGIIDKLGGVAITVTQEELGYLNGYIAEINTLQGLPVNDGQLAQAGSYQLNGKQALAYSRIRYIGTDFARTERQRTVLDGLFQQLKTASPKELYEVATTILPDITTNIDDIDLTKMTAKSMFYMKYDIVQNRIPMDGTWNDLVVGGQEVLEINFEANQEGLKSIIYGE